ncbi:MAG: hypothetical protein LBG18_02355, partial [Mediterranea sp.]|nr:hypothetical protein [Mediterranea sp.]
KNTTEYSWLPARDNNLWSTNGIASGQKTIYDPCPLGWRVPARVAISESDDDSPWKGVAAPTSWSSGSDSSGANWGTNAKYPAAGSRSGSSGSIDYEGLRGFYWNASPYNYSASTLYFRSNSYISRSSSNNRANGISVRCVKE